MKPLSRLLPPENILLDFQATSKKRVFEHIGLLFENNQGIGQRVVFDSLLARERLVSTGLGQGIAIPHGRIEGLRAPQGAFIRLASPVPFESPDGLPVSMLFALLVPEQAVRAPAAARAMAPPSSMRRLGVIWDRQGVGVISGAPLHRGASTLDTRTD